MPLFELVSDFAPAGDQPEAIAALAAGLRRGDSAQTLLGITGSGKSFTIAGLIAEVQRPTLVLAPNKSLAAQLASEFREFFPKNRVEYFVSYYTITNQKHTCLPPIPSLRRIHRLTPRSIACATLQRLHCSRVVMW